jgi:molybdenum cofactor sulfurtransferase
MQVRLPFSWSSRRAHQGATLVHQISRLSSREEALTAFQQKYPTYASTRYLDELRAREYARLDRQGQVYLDYTGGGLYAESQLQAHLAILTSNVFGNPHSTNPASQATTDLVEHARRYVLEYFNADPGEYEAIFTANATGALKLVGESYPFGPGGRYLLTFDNHNSVNGIREFARSKGALVSYVPITAPDLRVDDELLLHHLDRGRGTRANLFAYPAQSNFSGVQHPLDWIEVARERGWDVLVDGASFVPTNRLDLGRWHPDFVPLSFYKIFGYPTGIGCLIARKPALAKLHRPWYAGGTITLSSVLAADDPGGGFYLTPGPAGFEDGTVNYLAIPAVEIGLKYIASIGVEMIHERVECLTGWLLEQLTALRHSNGKPVVRIYGPQTTDRRGGTIAFNFLNPEGQLLDCYQAQERINHHAVSVRSGCFCNPGVREVALGFTRPGLANCFREKEQMTYEQFLRVSAGHLTGALRVSVGLATTFGDAYRFVQVARTFIDSMV